MVLNYQRTRREEIAVNHRQTRPARVISAARAIMAAAALSLAGCHSALVDATITNRTAAPITLVQVEYPSASFGTQALAPGQEFHYRFKILGSGTMKMTYTDAAQAEQKATGPTLHEGEEGTLAIAVTTTGTVWQPVLKTK